MSIFNPLNQTESAPRILQAGFFIGLAGGSAEIVVVWLYSLLTGGDAAMVARHIASAVGLDGSSATAGLAIHMGLAVALGIALSTTVQMLAGLLSRDGAIFCFTLGILAAVWVINYFVILPVVCPTFVHLLPYAVTLASKLAFGVTAATTLNVLKIGSVIAENLDLAGSLR
jgi:hypothetical protein